MVALVIFPSPQHDARIERIADDAMDESLVYFRAGARTEAFGVEDFRYFIQASAALRVQLEDTGDEWRDFLIEIERFRRFIVHISERGMIWPSAAFQFRAISTLNIRGKVINIFFGDAEVERHHKLVVRSVMERFFGCTDFFDKTFVHEFDHKPAVYHVAGDAIGFPNEEHAFGVLFDEREHFVKDRAAGRLGRLRFFENFGDREAIAFGDPREFRSLRINRKHLPILGLG